VKYVPYVVAGLGAAFFADNYIHALGLVLMIMSIIVAIELSADKRK
jgi:hypothetical protein